jgi:hypothetical protein
MNNIQVESGAVLLYQIASTIIISFLALIITMCCFLYKSMVAHLPAPTLAYVREVTAIVASGASQAPPENREALVVDAVTAALTAAHMTVSEELVRYAVRAELAKASGN